MFAEEYEEHLRATTRKKGTSAAPFDAQRNAAASWSKPGAQQNLDVVFRGICAEEEPPNEEQRAFFESSRPTIETGSSGTAVAMDKQVCR